MIAENRLRNAQSSIEQAKRKLKKLKSHEDSEVVQHARRAIRELEDAEFAINQAVSQIRNS